VIAILTLIESVRALLPHAPIFVSTTTLSGFDTAKEKLGSRIAGLFFAPVDYSSVVRRVLRQIRPSVLVVAETEIWPNLFRETRRTGCALILVNGRISDRAAPRYFALRTLFRVVLCEPDVILAQSEIMRERFLRAGAPPTKVHAAGNLKYDLAPEPVPADSPVRRFFAGSQVWIAASTSEDAQLAEEDAVLGAFKRLNGWKLLLAPRRPERFAEVARKIEKAGLRYVRRTALAEDCTGDILLLDTLGELSSLFALADSVFVGGTLVRHGGHNILEPALFGKTITVGPHMENFREIAEDFQQRNAIYRIPGASALEPFVDKEMGERARQCAEEKRGAVARAATQIRDLHECVLLSPPRGLLGRIALAPLAQAWQWGGRRKRLRSLANRRKLNLPVVSVGNITVGGTGKTPMTVHLARRFHEAGLRPGVLTRGYGRASPHNVLVVQPGETANSGHTGDEAQILLASGILSLGVGSDRFQTGSMLEERKLADVLILDDGFQHVSLDRNVDVVLIDALQPFGGHALVPLGRLREPLEELARASVFVITRVEEGRSTEAIEAVLRRYNPSAPVFRSRVVAREWVDLQSGERFGPRDLPFRRTLAFCGLGNPQSFWNTLRSLGISPVESLEYGDHHLYTPREVLRFGQMGRALTVDALLTTEKDAMNLCDHTAQVIAPLKLFSLRIGIEIEREEEFMQLIHKGLR